MKPAFRWTVAADHHLWLQTSSFWVLISRDLGPNNRTIHNKLSFNNIRKQIGIAAKQPLCERVHCVSYTLV